MPQRSPAEIRSSIEANRNELAVSIVQLRGEVAYLTDWRGHLERHRREVILAGRGRRPRAGRAPAAPPSRRPLSGARLRLGHCSQPRLPRHSWPQPRRIRPGPV